jgi:hypothetical protein
LCESCFFVWADVVFCVAKTEKTSQMPEYAGLNSNVGRPFDYDIRTRGLGATRDRPASATSEENLLCLPYSDSPLTGDWYNGESIRFPFSPLFFVFLFRC